MKFIAHRGNFYGPNPNMENSIPYILKCINLGYNVEIDLWYENDKWFLGHDNPQYQTNIEFILKYTDNLWCHAKNKGALQELLKYKEINCFWHQEDDYTITTHKYIWVYPGQPLVPGCICVMPERANYTMKELKQCYGICTDFVNKYKDLIIYKN